MPPYGANAGVPSHAVKQFPSMFSKHHHRHHQQSDDLSIRVPCGQRYPPSRRARRGDKYLRWFRSLLNPRSPRTQSRH